MSGPPMTCRQRRYIIDLWEKLDDDDPEKKGLEGIESADLNIEQASYVIHRIKTRIEKTRFSRKD